MRMVRPFGLIEMARTGEIAISRGARRDRNLSGRVRCRRGDAGSASRVCWSAVRARFAVPGGAAGRCCWGGRSRSIRPGTRGAVVFATARGGGRTGSASSSRIATARRWRALGRRGAAAGLGRGPVRARGFGLAGAGGRCWSPTPPDGPPGAGLVAGRRVSRSRPPAGTLRRTGRASPPPTSWFRMVALARRGGDVRLTLAALAAPDDVPEELCARLSARYLSLRRDPLPLLDPAPAVAVRDLLGRAAGALRAGRRPAPSSASAPGELEKIVLAREWSS